MPKIGFSSFKNARRSFSSYRSRDGSVFTELLSGVGRLFGTEFQVNTIHHQSVKQLGRGLRVTARSCFFYLQYVFELF